EQFDAKAKETRAQAETAMIDHLKAAKENIDRKLQELKYDAREPPREGHEQNRGRGGEVLRPPSISAAPNSKALRRNGRQRTRSTKTVQSGPLVRQGGLPRTANTDESCRRSRHQE